VVVFARLTRPPIGLPYGLDTMVLAGRLTTYRGFYHGLHTMVLACRLTTYHGFVTMVDHGFVTMV